MEARPVPAVTCTFGHYTQTGPWSDRRTMPWADLARLLTSHAAGPKGGTCIVPATFTGGRRHKDDAARIEAVLLDSDCGHALDEIRAAIAGRGWAAVVASTHSHRTTRTKAKRGDWDKFRVAAPEGGEAAAAAAFLVAKGYLPGVAEGAVVATETGQHVVLEHAPCPKFRLALPLREPWIAAAYASQRAANAAWKDRVEALAAALGLRHDQACTDTSRLFFLPRRPAEGPAPETAILEGLPCDLFALPSRPRHGRSGKGPGDPRRRPGRDRDPILHTDPSTGRAVDLRSWARETAGRFEIVDALRARSPGVFHGRVVQGRHHLRCVNEAAHTEPGEDLATFAVNASESTSRGFVVHCRYAHCDGRDRLLFLQQMLAEGWLAADDLTASAHLAAEDKGRPLIRIAGGAMPRVVDQAEGALLRARAGLYQRGPFIVRPGSVLVRTHAEHEVPARRVFEVEEHALAEAMTQAADWEKFDARSGAWVPIDAPVKVATTYRQRKGNWRLPVLSGLINAPILRADGTVLSEPGYDTATGLLLETGAVRFPGVPRTPDWEEGRQAVSVLMRLVEEFPFVGEADRAVALSAILTACVRRSLPTAPLHAFTAPVMGSGKSKLVDIACLIAIGREAAVISQGKTEEELEKRVGALLLAGETVLAIDNCEVPLRGEFLCAVLTQKTARTRILGKSEAPELPTDALFTATGNNLVLLGDMTRRAVVCRLDPQCERPELRTFASDPLAAIKADRPRFLVAALTALRAYHAAGRPKQAEALGSFEGWSRTVRDALLWLGLANPVETMEALRESDPSLDALLAVLSQWSAVIGTEKVSVREIIDRATEQATAGRAGGIASPRSASRHPDFREALLTVAGDNGVINSRRLGKWLGAQHGRIVEGRRINRVGLSAGNLQWQLQEVGTEPRAAA